MRLTLEVAAGIVLAYLLIRFSRVILDVVVVLTAFGLFALMLSAVHYWIEGPFDPAHWLFWGAFSVFGVWAISIMER